jgi:ribosome maturation factor RimP
MPLPLEIESRLNEIRSEIEQAGAELVEVFYRRAGTRGVLTFLVDKNGGISLEECAAVNQRLGSYFDRLADENGAVGFLQGAYFLEVNSPGLDRPLRTPKDYERALGQTLHVKTRDGRGTVMAFVGKLTGMDEAGIELEAGAGERRRLRFDEIFKATRDVAIRKR